MSVALRSNYKAGGMGLLPSSFSLLIALMCLFQLYYQVGRSSAAFPSKANSMNDLPVLPLPTSWSSPGSAEPPADVPSGLDAVHPSIPNSSLASGVHLGWQAWRKLRNDSWVGLLPPRLPVILINHNLRRSPDYQHVKYEDRMLECS